MRTLPLVLLLTLGLCHGLFAKVVYVDDNATAGGDGTSWASAHKYLQDALADVNASDEIWVAEGTYKPDQGAGKTAGDRTSPFLLVNGVGMYGGFKGTETTRTPDGDGNQTILSGKIDDNSMLWSLHVVYGENLDANTTMDGFRITKGKANGNDEGVPFGNGGGMVLKSSSPILTNCVFSNNSAEFGGGLENNSSSPTLTNCTFTNNSGLFGAGMFNHSNSSPTLINCTFANNNAGAWWGGGMDNDPDSSPTLTNCVFTGNSSDLAGGGMSNYGSPTLTNCVFTNNTANEKGGGVDDESGEGTFVNTIFHQNTSGSGHADLYYEVDEAIPAVPLSKVSYCLVSGGYSGTGNVDGSPLFVNVDDPIGPDDMWFTADDGLRLKDGSPAIDAGYNASLPADTNDLDGDDNKTELTPYDLLGRIRLVGSAVDLGPYEFDPANPPSSLVKTHLVGVSATTGGLATGGGDIEEGNSTTLTATPNTGYLFTGWSGDATGATNPLTITVDAAKTITANFIKDTSDDDGDGLSNYEEMAVHGTDKTKADTDGDGLTDKQEIDRGWNAHSSDKAVIDAVMEMMGATPSTTPYTDGWFYYPSRGWMYTKRSIYPYFYDSSTKAWMYFKSGEDKPRFYHYGTKAWVTLGE